MIDIYKVYEGRVDKTHQPTTTDNEPEYVFVGRFRSEKQAQIIAEDIITNLEKINTCRKDNLFVGLKYVYGTKIGTPLL